MQGSPRIDELRQKFHENPRRYFAPLANEYRKAGDPEQAIAICRAHLAQQPAHMSGHVVYGQALHDAGRPDEARTVFEKALSLDPDNAIVLRGLGRIARERGEATEARHWYTRALDLDPQDTEAAAYVAELAEPLTEQAAGELAPPSVGGVPDTADDPRASAEAAEGPQAPEVEGTSMGPEVRESEPDSPPAAPSQTGETGETGDDEDAPWRKTPVPEASPFVTRTMAELYARQGHDAAALDVYRQLALRHPEDETIRARISELAEPEPTADSAGAEMDAGAGILSDEPIFAAAADAPADAPSEAPSPAFSDAPADAPAAAPADAPADAAGDATREPDSHFTETELLTEHAWSADVWSRGFMSHESLDVDLEFAETAESSNLDMAAETATGEPGTGDAVSDELVDESSAAEARAPAEKPPAETASEETASEEIASGETALELASGETAPEEIVPEEAIPEAMGAHPIAGEVAESAAADTGAEAVADDDGMAPHTVLQGDEAAQAMISQPTAELVADSTPAESLDALAAAETGVEPGWPAGEELDEESGEESGVVAYSPEPPPDEDLPHFTPKGPTIREFFATLGARRPEPAEERSFTARAAIPSGAPAPEEDLPLATDALASLFPDSPVTEEDTRAAFALSGALSSTAHSPVPPRVQTSPPHPAPAVQETGEESEEDIRRFREWLDGLSES